MVNYIKQIARTVLEENHSASLLQSNFSILFEELNRIDPRDFLPDARFEFVRARRSVYLLSKPGLPSPSYEEKEFSGIQPLIEKILDVLDLYGGEGSRAEIRTFQFIQNDKLRHIIERDYRELSLYLLPSGAWKSTVVMAGSVTEAILFDLMANNTERNQRALGAKSAPNNKGIVYPIEGEKWKLHDLLSVAGEIDLLPKARINTFDQILRDYRNFVHPNKEIRAEHHCNEAEAYMAKGALDGICDHFARTLL